MEQPKKPHHPWKMRLLVAFLMILLAFIGLVISDTAKDGAWLYWRAMAPVFALLSIFLSWFIRLKADFKLSKEIWQELVHWGILILSVYLISAFVGLGLIGRFEAGLVILVLIALTTSLAGIYHDFMFLVIGVMLGFFALSTATLSAYLYSVILPITLIISTLLGVFIFKRHRKELKINSLKK